jgi:DNA-binding response OmpR family regulator
MLLLVEDDNVIGCTLDATLRDSGHAVAWAQYGAAALTLCEQVNFDLVLLDLGLPDLDGFDVCRQIRTLQQSCVLIILTASHVESDVVVGLESGADDYLTKPFRSAELLARIQAHLRRGTASSTPPRTQRSGSLVIDKLRRVSSLGDVAVALRPKEFDLLSRLVAEGGGVVSRSDLIIDVWGKTWIGANKTLDVHISTLRKRLSIAAAASGATAPSVITVRGHGFRIAADSDRSP